MTPATARVIAVSLKSPSHAEGLFFPSCRGGLLLPNLDDQS